MRHGRKYAKINALNRAPAGILRIPFERGTFSVTIDIQHKRISVAPMMDWTTRDYRFFARLLNPHVWLYSEMISTGAILHGDHARHLDFDAREQPLVLQLGGADPAELAACSRIAQDWGYAEVNLNVGCPSDRVQQHKIGACLMAEPELVAECVYAMQQAVDIPQQRIAAAVQRLDVQ